MNKTHLNLDLLSTVTRLWTGWSETEDSISRRGNRTFSFFAQHSDWVWIPPAFHPMGTTVFYLWLKTDWE